MIKQTQRTLLSLPSAADVLASRMHPGRHNEAQEPFADSVHTAPVKGHQLADGRKAVVGVWVLDLDWI